MSGANPNYIEGYCVEKLAPNMLSEAYGPDKWMRYADHDATILALRACPFCHGQIKDPETLRKVMPSALDEQGRCDECGGEGTAEAARSRSQAQLGLARYEITKLRAALQRAHCCATLRDDGTCEGCFVSAALDECDKSAAKKSLGGEA